MSQGSARGYWAMGGTIFAATTMLIIGFFQALMGIAAIARDALFLAGPQYTYGLGTMGWGWIHLIIGALVIVTGCFLYGRATWARAAGIGLAVLSAVGNFLFLPYYPLWSILIIALDVFVIWALATVGGPQPPTAEATEDAESTGRRLQREDWPQVNAPNVPRDSDQTMYPGATGDDTGRPAAPHRQDQGGAGTP